MTGNALPVDDADVDGERIEAFDAAEIDPVAIPSDHHRRYR